MGLDLLYRQHAEDGNGEDPTENGCRGDAEAGQAEGEVVIGVKRFHCIMYIQFCILQLPDNAAHYLSFLIRVYRYHQVISTLS